VYPTASVDTAERRLVASAVRGRLAPEVGAVLVQVLAAAREALYQRAHTRELRYR